ncbi:MAG: CDGSH iron-sulfur domain-containing protein, partial [Nitrospirota bacterium]
YYCSCNKSANMPYCDGSHQGTENQPYKVEIEEEKDIAICGCGGSKNMPYCDGSHANM